MGSTTSSNCCLDCWDKLFNHKTFKKSILNTDYQKEKLIAKEAKSKQIELAEKPQNLAAPLIPPKEKEPIPSLDKKKSATNPTKQRGVNIDDFLYISVKYP